MPAMSSTLSPDTLRVLQVLAQSLRDGRKRRRLRQADLATRAGISRATVQRMERGDPGIGIGAYLEALTVIDRALLERVKNELVEDAAGVRLMTSQLPKRVRPQGADDDF